MKINGVTVTPPEDDFLVLPRGENQLVFRARPLPNMDEFHKRCPEPQVPGGFNNKGDWIPDPNNSDYLKITERHAKKRLGFMVVRTLEPSKIEWEKVDIDNPMTWGLWEEELLQSGMTQIEVNRVLQLVMEANSLSEGKLDKAREDFVRGQAQALAAASGQTSEQPNMPSGEPATDSE